mgnify:CR=1 FL=1
MPEKNSIIEVNNFHEILQALGKDHFKDLWLDTLNKCGVCDSEIVYDWDRRDTFPVDLLAQYVNHARKSSDNTNVLTIEMFAMDYLSEEPSFWEIFNPYEDYIASRFEKVLNAENIELSDEFEWRDFFYTALDMGWLKEHCNVEELLGQTRLRCNLMLATPEERNVDSVACEMGDVVIGNDDFSPSFWDDEQEVRAFWTNAVTWLVQQQGYKLSDLFDKEKAKQSKFLSSMREELDNLTGGCPFLNVLVGTDALTLGALVNKDEKTIDMPTNTVVGLYSHVDGSGSILGVELERPLIIPKELIANISIEGADREHQLGYTVDDTYGLVKDAWVPGLRVGNEPTPSIEDVRNSIDVSEIKTLVKTAVQNAKVKTDLDTEGPTL